VRLTPAPQQPLLLSFFLLLSFITTLLEMLCSNNKGSSKGNKSNLAVLFFLMSMPARWDPTKRNYQQKDEKLFLLSLDSIEEEEEEEGETAAAPARPASKETSEQLLWRREMTKGKFKKQIIQVQTVTNKAIRLDNNYAISLFDLDDIAVTNRHSVSEGGHTSYSTGGGRHGGGIRVGMGQSKGRSRRYGDVVFFVNGQAVLTLFEVEDPSGLVHLIKAAKKRRDNSNRVRLR
jgi:hypothetical protein